jgi:uncharacterized membrane protein
MDQVATPLSAVASLAWPVVVAAMLFVLTGPIKKLVESARARKFTIKVAGNQLTMEEAREMQRQILSDLQAKLAELEQRVGPQLPGANVLTRQVANGFYPVSTDGSDESARESGLD